MRSVIWKEDHVCLIESIWCSILHARLGRILRVGITNVIRGSNNICSCSISSNRMRPPLSESYSLLISVVWSEIGAILLRKPLLILRHFDILIIQEIIHDLMALLLLIVCLILAHLSTDPQTGYC